MAITDTIEQSIAELIGRLPQADALESARIHTRIEELEELKKEYGTTT